VKVFCSLPFTLRIGLSLLAIGFVLGVMAGYQAGAAGDRSRPTTGDSTDIRAIRPVVTLERSQQPCTLISCSSSAC
jgi:hypothetical protein